MQKPARYLVIVEQDGGMLARLFDDDMRLAAEFDASSEEVVVMTAGLQPQRGAIAAQWDKPLRGHSASERAAALVYTLDV
ncbi:hypothetical protein [Ideonella sp. BN130291]|uniref:hypothetical protein n=1 Tax=Ideonella sp. BN130291 TaxID=3112940 RepID=UPI002E256820|nr:hypothetical protein [Ideonella sp. BN130291]